MSHHDQMQYGGGYGEAHDMGGVPPPSGAPDRDRRERDSRRDDRDRGHSSRSDRDRDRDRGGDRDRDRRDKDRSSRDKDRERPRDDKGKSSSGRSSSRDRSKRKRSPSPDLVYKKKRTGWDQMPTGLEIFTQPAVIKPTIGSVFNNLNAQAKQQKRLYIGNVPAQVQDDELIDFFNRAMVNGRKTTQPGNPIIACQMNRDKAYAFLEFRTAEEASAGMSLDGINLQGHALKVRRPKDYVPTAGEEHIADPTVPNSDGSTGPVANIVSTNVEDTPNKIFIGGIPPNLNEADVRELLQVFGALKSFNLVRDTTTGASKGYAFCEYLDPNITDNACKGLNGMKIVDKNLVVQRASVGSKNSMVMPVGGKIREPTNIAAASLMNLVTPLPTLLKAIIKDAKPVEPTKVLVLLNCVNVDDFPEGDAYNDMIEDIKEECKKHGRVRSVVIPQPPAKPQAQLIDGQMVTPQAPEQTGEDDPLEPKVPGLGKIFIEFSKVEDARRAQVALGGRRYDGRLIITTFFDEEKFKAGERRVTLAHLVGEQSAEDMQLLQRQQQQFAMAAMHNTFVKGDDYHA